MRFSSSQYPHFATHPQPRFLPLAVVQGDSFARKLIYMEREETEWDMEIPDPEPRNVIEGVARAAFLRR